MADSGTDHVIIIMIFDICFFFFFSISHRTNLALHNQPLGLANSKKKLRRKSGEEKRKGKGEGM